MRACRHVCVAVGSYIGRQRKKGRCMLFHPHCYHESPVHSTVYIRAHAQDVDDVIDDDFILFGYGANEVTSLVSILDSP